MRQNFWRIYYRIKWAIAERWLSVSKKMPRIPRRQPSPPMDTCPECGGHVELKAVDTGDGWDIFWDCENYCNAIEEDKAHISDWFPFVFGWASTSDLERVGIEVV